MTQAAIPLSQREPVLWAQQRDGGPACFYVPRWRPDGSRNAVAMQRLKDKVGNCSNASSEVESHDAWGVLIGDPGRGIPAIIEMATYARFNCVIGSAALARPDVMLDPHCQTMGLYGPECWTYTPPHFVLKRRACGTPQRPSAPWAQQNSQFANVFGDCGRAGKPRPLKPPTPGFRAGWW
ncbi:hypothetical protein AAFM71_03120 [Chromobacterium violaceum]|uniref:hypothetical protein n=1 Tax=Chromobacterium violaceum TaxID=536 RepID=UPI00385EC593